MLHHLRELIKPIEDKLEPVKGIALFLFLFLFFELLWKFCLHFGSNGVDFIVLGHDFSSWIYPVCQLDARIVYHIIHDWMGYDSFTIKDTILYFDHPYAMRLQIVWNCTSVKQYCLFLFVMIFYYGPWKKKLVFIPVSLLLLSAVNILRLVITAFVIKDGFPQWFIPVNEILNGATWDSSKATYWKFYSDWYHFFHDGVFKWVYYDGVMFLMWLWWQEKINLPYQRSKIVEKK